MTDVEDTVVAEEVNEEVQVAANGDDAEAAQPQKRERKVPVKADKPNEADFTANQKKTELEIESLQKQIRDKIQHKIDQLVATRNKSRDQVKSKIGLAKELRAKKQAAGSERETINTQLLRMEQEIEAKKKRLEEARKKLKFRNADAVDEEVRKLEYKLHHTSMSLRDEKELIAEIKSLSSAKNDISKYNDEKTQAESSDDQAVLNALRDVRKEKTRLFVEFKEAEIKLNEEINALKTEEEKSNEEVVKLIASKKELNDKITALMEANKEARRQYKQQERAWNDWSEYQEYLRRQRVREERKARAEEAKARQAEYEKEEAERDHWAEEKELCQNLLRYLQRLVQPNAGSSKSAVDALVGRRGWNRELDGPRPNRERADMEDAVSATQFKKEEDDLTSILGGVSNKKNNNKPKKAAAAPASSDAASAAPEKKKASTKITHTPESFIQFDAVELTPPLDLAAVPAAIQAVQDKLAFFEANPDKSLQEKMKQDRMQRLKQAAALVNQKAAAAPLPDVDPVLGAPKATSSSSSSAQESSSQSSDA